MDSGDDQIIKNLYEAIIRDMYELANDRLPEELKQTKTIVVNGFKKKQIYEDVNEKDLEDKAYLMVSVLGEIIYQFQKKETYKKSRVLHFLKSFLETAVNLYRDEKNFIPDKNIYSLIIYGYCCLECFSYLFKKENILYPNYIRRSFDSNNCKNLFKFLEANSLGNSTKNVYNSFQMNYFSENKDTTKTKGDEDIILHNFLKSMNSHDFMQNFNDYKAKMELKKQKKKQNKTAKNKNKETNNSRINDTQEKNNKDDQVQEKNIKDNQTQENNNKDNQTQENNNKYNQTQEKKKENYENLIKSLTESKHVLSEDIIIGLISALNELKEQREKIEEFEKVKNEVNELKNRANDSEKRENDLKITLQNEKKNFRDELDKLKKNNDILMKNQKKLWNFINLLTNGRDTVKSIVFNLYEYFGLEGQKKTFYQLGQMLKSLKSGELDNKFNDNTISKEKLDQFLLLSFFLKNFLNKILHREFSIEEIDHENEITDEKSLKFIPDNSFDSFFKNIEEFLEITIMESQIQQFIRKAITEYINDKELPEELKYQEGKIFEINNSNSIYKPILNKDDIISIYNYFKAIKLNDKGFDQCCNEKIWKDEFYNDILVTPYFYNSNLNNSDNNN